MKTTVVTPPDAGTKRETIKADTLSTTSVASVKLLSPTAPPLLESLSGEAASKCNAASPLDAAPSPDDEFAHMRRRLFRTLDRPDRSMIAIDCGAVPIEKIRDLTDSFFSHPTLRDENNMVLAIPTDQAFSSSPTFDFIQSIKEQAFENHLDGKVSWLLIHDTDTELGALRSLVRQQGGQWHGE